MAVLNPPPNQTNPFAQEVGDAPAPAGTYVATVLKIHDEFGVMRQRFQSTETEKVDLTCFLFGFRDAHGNPHKVASRQMKISGSEKSALFGFLKALLGKAPAYGWDYCSLKGHKCLLTVEHVQRRDGSGVYAAIAALSPVPAGYPTSSVAAPAVGPTPQPAPQPPPAAAPGPQPVPPATAAEDDIPF